MDCVALFLVSRGSLTCYSLVTQTFQNMFDSLHSLQVSSLSLIACDNNTHDILFCGYAKHTKTKSRAKKKRNLALSKLSYSQALVDA